MFRNYYTSECYGNLSTNRDHKRIDSIIAASKIRNDTLHNTLSPLLAENENLKIHYHNKCVSKYCSTKSLVEKAPPAKRQRHSDVALFNFKTQCLYCGLDCPLVPVDPRHPERWKKACLAASTKHFCAQRKIIISQKQHIQEVCRLKQDSLIRYDTCESNNNANLYQTCKSVVHSPRPIILCLHVWSAII